MTSAWSYDFYHFGDKEADHCGEGDNRNLAGNKVPLKTIEGATCGKVYLRDDSCLGNVSSFLDLATQNIRRLCSYSGKETKITISLGSSYLPSLIYTVLILASSTP